MDQALLQSAARHRPRHAVVAHNRGRTARRNALARRPLVRAAAPVGPSICARSTVSPSLRWTYGARPAVLMVPGNGADAEAARAVRSAAGGRRDSSHVEVKYSRNVRIATRCIRGLRVILHCWFWSLKRSRRELSTFSASRRSRTLFLASGRWHGLADWLGVARHPR